MYAMAIFSAYALPSLLYMGGLLYDYRLYSASGMSFIIISIMVVWPIQMIVGIIGMLLGVAIIILDIIYSYKNKYDKNKIIKVNTAPIFQIFQKAQQK